MDIEKIVTDLVEKRIDEFLAQSVANVMEYRDRVEGLREFIQNIIMQAAREMEPQIKEGIKESISSMVLSGTRCPEIRFSLDMSPSSWQIEERLREIKKAELKAFEAKKEPNFNLTTSDVPAYGPLPKL